MSKQQATCKHRVMVIDRDDYIKPSKQCSAPANDQGWCKEHAQAQEILNIGELAGYPRIEVSEYQTLEAGQASWEEYAVYSLCKIPIMKNFKQVYAPTGLAKLTPHLNTLIASIRSSETQERLSSQQDVQSSNNLQKPPRNGPQTDLEDLETSNAWGSFDEPIIPQKKQQSKTPVAVLDRGEDIDIDPEVVYTF